MTTYKQMKHALLNNNTIEMYKPTARLIQMVTILACHGIVSIVTNGTDWRVTLTRKSSIRENQTVADVDLKATSAHIRLHPRTIYHKNGTKEIREQYSSKAYPVIGHRNGFELLDTGHGIIGRKAENIKAA